MKKNKKISMVLGLFFVFSVAMGILFLSTCFRLLTDKDEIKTDGGENQANEILSSNNSAVEKAFEKNTEQVAGLQNFDGYIGQKDAKAEVVVYNGVGCEACEEGFEIAEKLAADYPNDVLIIFRPFILPDKKSLSQKFFEITDCARQQGKFWQIYKIIQEEGEQDLDFYAREAVLDKEEIEECLQKKDFDDKMDFYEKEIENLGIIGVPSIFINKIFYPYNEYENFVNKDGKEIKGIKSLIEQEINKK